MSLWRLGRIGGVGGQLHGFALIVVAGLLLFGPCLAFPPLAGSVPTNSLCQATLMCTSQITPWGVVTGLFLFDGIYNVIIFGVVGVMFAQMNLGESTRERSRRSRFFLVTGFGTAIAANCVWMLSNPTAFSRGQSGVVFSLLGTVVATVCCKGLPARGIGQSVASRKNALLSMMSASTVVLVVLLVATPLASSFFGGAGMNQTVHEVTFVASFVLTVPYYYLGQK